MWIVWRSNPSVKSHRSKTIKSGKNKVTLSLSILNISLMWHKHFFLVVSMRKLSPACYTIQAFPYQVSANGRWVIWSIDHFFCHMMVSWPHIIHILPGYTKCICYQHSFWISIYLILFLGRSIRPAEPSQKAEDGAQQPGQQRLLLRLPDVLELHLTPGVQPDHNDHHLCLGEQGAPLPRHLLTTDNGDTVQRIN